MGALPSLFPQPTAPSAVRLTLEPTLARAGMFDGAWWPHSRDVRAELPGLITALSAHLGAILRVGLDQDAWDDIPRSLTIDGRVVHIGWFTASDDTMSVTRGLNDHFMLLVVPPWATAPAAAAAMAMAARTGNRMPAATILAATGTTPKSPTRCPCRRSTRRASGSRRPKAAPQALFSPHRSARRCGAPPSSSHPAWSRTASRPSSARPG